MLRKLWDLFIGFTRASNLGFGGGPSLIPLVKAEAVDRYHWMDNQEFADALAIGNALPGPIATKMAAYTGYKVAGWLGALAATIGTVAPTVIVVVLLGSLIMKYSHSSELQAMLMAVRPVVVVLVAETAYDMGKRAFPSSSTWGVAVVTIALLYLVNIHPAFIIVASMLFGWLVYGKAKKTN
ncbi:chromate transporter [Desulfosporosinus meridiei]|uniref:Chromate transport protein ChrA n=1 Tax=Desulfosporosinus meridiei (strain ATCC BAA-275 / DSM 13257 / KCTC 12902 / NCIMB 13706 / S10) TaxID=768704 RepID=J7IMX3_DESMD|nr:chromate transporter [Desulfosporosinus meridiei]AFQ42925.1 chromate transport protein ChrA [Desulfosporosinus meridiei DSM 13257]